MILPLQASSASSALNVPSVALLILAIIALASASFAQSVEQALDGLLDALGDRRGHQGDDRENQERHGGHIQDRRGRGHLKGKDHRVARKVRRSLRWRANMTSRSASVA